MSAMILLDVVRMEQAEKIRKAANERLAGAHRTHRQTPVLKALLLSLFRS